MKEADFFSKMRLVGSFYMKKKLPKLSAVAEVPVSIPVWVLTWKMIPPEERDVGHQLQDLKPDAINHW